MEKKPLGVIVGIIVIIIIGILLLFFLRPKNVGEPITEPSAFDGSAKQPGATPTKTVQGPVDIKMSLGNIEPKKFAVKAGSQLTINLSGSDSAHIFKFEDPGLSNVFSSIGGSRTTDSITFTVPSKKGSYVFYCDTPGHRARGEEGVMTVQ